jgi:hypothetical protein
MEAVPHMRKLVLAGGIAVLATLGTSAAAYGKGCSTNQNVPSSVAQYVEQQPTACGTQPTGQGNQSRKIPKQIEKKIDSQSGDSGDATLLKNIVSKQSYGAPQAKIKVKAKKVKKANKANKATKGKKVTVKKQGDASTGVPGDIAAKKSNALAASVGVITDGSDGRLIALIVLMAAVAAIVIISALRRRRTTR